MSHSAAPAQGRVKWFSKPGEHSARQETPSAGSVTFPGPRGSLISLRECLKCENSKEEQEFLILVPSVLLAISRRNKKWKKQLQLTPPRQSFQFQLCTPHTPGAASNSVFSLSNSSILCTNFLPAILELLKFSFSLQYFCQSLKWFSESCLTALQVETVLH